MLRAMGGAGFYAETKYDGDRIQLHWRGATCKYFTRSPKDYTERFGGDASAGTHCPHIHRAFDRCDVVLCGVVKCGDAIQIRAQLHSGRRDGGLGSRRWYFHAQGR